MKFNRTSRIRRTKLNRRFEVPTLVAINWKLLLLLFFLSITATPSVHAGTKTIGLLGARWETYAITVRIPSTPAWMSQEVVNAIQAWNQAQDWFTKTYYPGGPVYKFAPSQTGTVIVRFQNLSVQPTSGLCTLGEETRPGYTAKRISSARVTLTGYCGTTPLNSDIVYLVAIHEFGHVLGVEHTNFDDPHDMMNTFFEADMQLSTLDLYAVHVLATGSASQESLSMPENIPYQFIPGWAIPEFPLPTIVLALVILGVICLVPRRSAGKND